MATIKLNHIFVLTSLLAFSVTDAFTKNEITDLCSEDNDPSSCVTVLEKDPKVGIAQQMNDVLVIVISMLEKEATDATTHLNTVRSQYSPSGKKEIDICIKNYGSAATSFQTAADMASKKSFQEVNKLMHVGYESVGDCKLTEKAPIQRNPIRLSLMKIGSLSSMVDILVEKLSGT